MREGERRREGEREYCSATCQLQKVDPPMFSLISLFSFLSVPVIEILLCRSTRSSYVLPVMMLHDLPFKSSKPLCVLIQIKKEDNFTCDLRVLIGSAQPKGQRFILIYESETNVCFTPFFLSVFCTVIPEGHL